MILSPQLSLGWRLLTKNPRLLLKKVAGKAKSLRTPPTGKQIIKLGDVQFELDPATDPLIAKMIAGAYELETIHIMERYLRPGSTFLDVGANIGYLSATALKLVGRSGQVHSFEPVPRYFDALQRLAQLNPNHHLTINQCALSDHAGTAQIAVTSLANIGWNTMVPNFMSNDPHKTMVSVPTARLDAYIQDKGITRVDLIKIDTEGFEFPVLRGLSHYLDQTPHRPVIICEIAPGAYPLLGTSLAELTAYMATYNYAPFDLIDPTERVDLTTLTETTNVIFR